MRSNFDNVKTRSRSISLNGRKLLIIFRLVQPGSSWTIVKNTRLQKIGYTVPTVALKRRMATGHAKLVAYHGDGRKMLQMTAIAKGGEPFKTSTSIVEVDSKEVARYTPQVEKQVEWEERQRQQRRNAALPSHMPH